MSAGREVVEGPLKKEDSRKRHRTDKSLAPKAGSTSNNPITKTPSLEELQAIINRPRYCTKPCPLELASRFKGWCLDGVCFDLNIDSSDHRSLPREIDIVQSNAIVRIDEAKDWLEMHLDRLSDYTAKQMAGWHNLACDLQRLNKEHLERISLLEEDKTHLIWALKSRDKIIAELLSPWKDTEEIGPSSSHDEE